MSSPGAGFLEGLAGGFEGGYGFREAVKGKRRAAKLAADLMTLRQQEAGRQEAAAGRAQTVFDEQQHAYHEAESLRTEVANYLSAPTRLPEGQVGPVQPPDLSPNARVAQTVGRTLGEFGGRDLTPDQQLLVGTGQVPYGAIQPKAYHPKNRQEYLDNLRIAAGLRGSASKLPITMDHAFTVLDRIYTVQDPKTGMWKSILTPGQRLKAAKKMVAGTVEPADFPDIPEDVSNPAATELAPAAGGGVMDRISRWWHGSGAPSATAPDVSGGRLPPQDEVPPGDYTVGDQQPSGNQRLEQARMTVSQYRDLPPDQIEEVLREQGFSDDEVRAILGSTP